MNMNKLASGALNDALVYLDRISPNQYQQEIPILSNASIGQHTRHFIEFYQCLVRQVNEQGNVINYAIRARDARIESDPAFARTCIHEVQEKLTALQDGQAYELECSDHMPGEGVIRVSTNLERELMYNIEHTIHHLAIIKIGLNAIGMEIDLPEHFGIAPSTIIHRNEKACAQ